jgi:hypothetical protein
MYVIYIHVLNPLRAPTWNKEVHSQILRPAVLRFVDEIQIITCM